jgi:hypothetical protein
VDNCRELAVVDADDDALYFSEFRKAETFNVLRVFVDLFCWLCCLPREKYVAEVGGSVVCWFIFGAGVVTSESGGDSCYHYCRWVGKYLFHL